ncbi:MAG: hypothetical protein SFX74_10745 [Fimbriimonadaceae bacterium]|nr:hypothetical protein [Fimbriimonadaceae bacterium]
MTLVELLVVIAIIVVVTSIAFAVAGGVRASAAISSCTANLGQIGKAVALYAADHDDFLPPVVTEQTSQRATGTNTWVDIVADSKRWRDSLMRYGNEDAIFFCPADRYARKPELAPHSGAHRSHEWTSYEVLHLFGFTITLTGIPMGRLSQMPHDRHYVSDAVLEKRFAGGGYPFETSHGTRAVHLKFDGSVRNVSLH